MPGGLAPRIAAFPDGTIFRTRIDVACRNCKVFSTFLHVGCVGGAIASGKVSVPFASP